MTDDAPKSALELALEKAEQYGRASKEDLAQEKFKEQARQLAVQYLKEGEVDLQKELAAIPSEAQAGARQAMKEVFLRNITRRLATKIVAHLTLEPPGRFDCWARRTA